MPYVAKAPVGTSSPSGVLSIHEKTMYGGKHVAVGDELFVFDSDHHGGVGLCARGVVTSVVPGERTRKVIEVRVTASPARQRLGRAELAPYREDEDGTPEGEVAWRLYRQPTDKIAGIAEETAAFLRTYFSP